MYRNIWGKSFCNVEDLDPSWGMGTKVTESVSNDRDYDWYIDQLSTGIHGEMNCGPTSIAMASKWQNRDSDIKAEELREKYQPEGYGVSFGDLYMWMEDCDIKEKWLRNMDEDLLKAEIDKGNIVIA